MAYGIVLNLMKDVLSIKLNVNVYIFGRTKFRLLV